MDYSPFTSSDYTIRSHQFFHSQNMWSNAVPPSCNSDYIWNKSAINKNVQMDEMFKLVLDCLAAISCFMDCNNYYNDDFIENHYDILKAKLFWEAVNCVTQTNISIIKNKINNNFDEAINNKEKDDNNNNNNDNSYQSAVNILIQRNFPAHKSSTNKSDWFPLLWASIINPNNNNNNNNNNIEISVTEYKQLLQNNTESIINQISSNNNKSLTVAHILCCCNNNNIDIVKTLFDNFPTLASQEDEFGYLPLHYAAIYCNDKHFLQYLIQQNPKALVTFTNNNNDMIPVQNPLPIHFSIRNNNNIIFRTLLESSRESVFMKTNYGKDLIYFCIKEMTFPMELLQLLNNNYPDLVKTPYSDGHYILHLACQQSNIDINKVKLILNSYREAVKIEVNGVFPLAYAASNSSLEVFQLIYDSYPQAAYSIDNEGYSLMHHAVINWQNVDTVKYVCENFNEFAEVKTTENFSLPLHFAVEFQESYEIINLVYNLNPAAVKVKVADKGNNRLLPIHYLDRYDSSPPMKTIELLAKDYPKSLDIYFYDDNVVYTTLYKKWSQLSPELHRLLSRLGRVKHEEDFRELNWKERRLAMFLAYRAVSAILHLNIWRKLKLQNNSELLRYTIAYL